MQKEITEILNRSSAVKAEIARNADLCGMIGRAAEAMIKCAREGGTVYSCGNGGSACDAMHLAEELVARYKRERPGIRAMHLMDPGTLTCWSNDYDFSGTFERQVQTFCTSKDVLVAFSTSGNSENILKAVEAARKAGTPVIGLTGKGGGKMAPLCTMPLVIPATETERIQEAHITIVHILCELLETRLFFSGN
jgi:D-sedoheptulose 7-phosphate isomerase